MTVFANGLEISCTAQANQVIAAFPDVCFTPPQTPATPPGVPIPYPSFASDSDVKSGTGTVKIGGKTISHKNKSHRKRTTGTEAGCAPKKNIITSVNTGKDYAHAWSANVKADKEPISRFFDICTNDHSSPNAGTPPMINSSSAGAGAQADNKCIVGPYNKIEERCQKYGGLSAEDNRVKGSGFRPEKHHIIPDRTYCTEKDGGGRIPGTPSEAEGICICLPKKNHRGSLKNNNNSVHGHLDSPLEGFGVANPATNPNRTPNIPADTEKLGKIALGCLLALFKLVPDPVSNDCFNLAVEEVTKQIKGKEDTLCRTKKNPIESAATKKMLLKPTTVR